MFYFLLISFSSRTSPILLESVNVSHVFNVDTLSFYGDYSLLSNRSLALSHSSASEVTNSSVVDACVSLGPRSAVWIAVNTATTYWITLVAFDFSCSCVF
jgi:hypothetical protein